MSVSHNYRYIPGFSNALQNIIPERLVLKIRQQPIQTRTSTNTERDRKPLDPPPIVQIEVDQSNVQETQAFLQNPYLFMCVSLVHSVTHEHITNTIQHPLSGQTVSSMYKLKDINNHDGGFFIFGDLSVKLEGQFRLKFSMFELSPFGATNLTSAYSNVFQVYSSKTFPGILESTFLSRSFSDQGVRIRIRKEHRVQIAGSRKRKSSSHEDRRNSMSHIPSPYERRRSSLMSDHSQFGYDRRPIIPVSPPHQTYDSDRCLGEEYKQHGMIPSPPPSLFKPTKDRRPSFEDRFMLRSSDDRRLSLQQSPLQQQQSVHDEVIHLPPLRTFIKEDVMEVDAAVAMMELATRKHMNHHYYK